MLDVRLSESTPLVEAASGTPKSRRFRARLIEGDVQGSSGYYPAEMLRRDGPNIFHAGLHVYADHPSLAESVDRPERSIKDLAGRLATDAVYEGDGLYAEVEVFPQYAPLIEGMADAIGMSIRAFGTAEASTQEGVRGPVITALTEGISVDFVTAAGAGGKLVELLESARAATLAERTGRPLSEARNVGAFMEAQIHRDFTNRADDMYGNGKLSRPERIGLSKAIGDGLASFTDRVTTDHPQLYERDLWDGPPDDAGTISEAARRVLREGHGMTANDLNAALTGAVRETYGGDHIFTWVRDNTDEWVVFSLESDDDCALYQQTYTVDEGTGAVTLTGEPAEVIARTTYVPAPTEPDDDPTEPSDELDEADPHNAPGAPPADPTQKEGGMPEITEEQARQLEEAASTRTQLDEAIAKLGEASGQIAELKERADKADARANDSDAKNQGLENDRAARAQVAEALKGSGLPELTFQRVTESVCRTLPTGDGGTLDTAKLAEAITAAIADEKTYVAGLAEASGAGMPRGLGEATHVEDGDFDKQLTEAFKGLGMDDKAALTAAHGRG